MQKQYIDKHNHAKSAGEQHKTNERVLFIET